VADAVERIAILLLLANQGLITVFFCDESGFSLRPFVPYGWQPKGEQWGFPSTRQKVANILGFLNPLTQQLVTYQLPEKAYMNSEFFIKYINDFVAKITGPTVLILDNASYHKSELTRSMYEEWKSKGLYLFFLPPRCPHLNLIETLWRKIKYEWLFIKDYRSKKALQQKLNHVFKTYGLNYCIEFSMNVFKNKINT